MICFFVGSADSFNVRRTTYNIGWMLSNDFDIHLVGIENSRIITESERYFDVYTKRVTSSVWDEYRLLKSYLKSNNPEVVVNVTRPPIHGNIIGLQTWNKDSKFVYRYSGDRFYEYRVMQGLKKIGIYGLNNVIGRLPLILGDQYIVLGPTGRSRLVDRGVSPDHITILPPPIDLEPFNKSDNGIDFGFPDHRKVALFLGRLSRLKGIGILEETIPEILNRRKDIQFVFVGGGDNVPDVPKEYGEHITLVGSVEPDKVPFYLRASDVLIHPSLTEGLSRAVVEALASGIPVIANDVGELSYVTENTFRTKTEFIEMVVNFENLCVDKVEEFSLESLKPRYVEFFNSI